MQAARWFLLLFFCSTGVKPAAAQNINDSVFHAAVMQDIYLVDAKLKKKRNPEKSLTQAVTYTICFSVARMPAL